MDFCRWSKIKPSLFFKEVFSFRKALLSREYIFSTTKFPIICFLFIFCDVDFWSEKGNFKSTAFCLRSFSCYIVALPFTLEIYFTTNAQKQTKVNTPIKLMLKAHCNNENDGNNNKNDTNDSTVATTIPSSKRHHTRIKNRCMIITTESRNTHRRK